MRSLAATVLGGVLLAVACGGAPERDPAAVTRRCNDARNACVRACAAGGNYVPAPCRDACETGRRTCEDADADWCRRFRDGCLDACGTDRCADACRAGDDVCPTA